MEKITIHDVSYRFASDFKDYYKSGYWNDRYIPYSLLDEGKIVANVSANILDFYPKFGFTKKSKYQYTKKSQGMKLTRLLGISIWMSQKTENSCFAFRIAHVPFPS